MGHVSEALVPSHHKHGDGFVSMRNTQFQQHICAPSAPLSDSLLMSHVQTAPLCPS